MPYEITPYQKSLLLQKRGLDENEWDIDPNSLTVVKKQVAEQPTSSDFSAVAPVQIKPKSSALGAGFRGFAENIPEVLGSIGTGAATGAGLGALGLNPITVGIGSVLGGIGGAFATSQYKRAALQKFAPEYLQRSQEVQAEHPAAYRAGQIGSSLVALKPDIRSIVGQGGAISSAGKILRGVPTTAAEKGVLANVGIGAAIPTGISAANTLQSGQFDPMDLVDIVAGAAINNPNRVGQKLFRLKPNVYDEEGPSTVNRRDLLEGPSMYEQALGESIKSFKPSRSYSSRGEKLTPTGVEVMRAEAEQRPPTAPKSAKSSAEFIAEEIKKREAVEIAKALRRPPKASGTKINEILGIGKPGMAPTEKQAVKEALLVRETQRANVEGARALAAEGPGVYRDVKEKLPTTKTYTPEEIDRLVGAQVKKHLAAAEEAAVVEAIKKRNPPEAPPPNPAPAKPTEPAKPLVNPPAPPANLAQQLEARDIARGKKPNVIDEWLSKPSDLPAPTPKQEAPPVPEAVPAPKQETTPTTPTTEELLPGQKPGELLVDYYTRIDKEGKPQVKEQGLQPAETTDRAQEVLKKAADEKVDLKATEKLFEFFKNIGAKREVDVAKGTFRGPLSKLRGLASLRDVGRKAAAYINPFKATVDTLPHEVFHNFLRDLKASPHKSDRNLHDKYLELVEKSPEYAGFKKVNPDATPEEFGTELAGYETVKRLFNLDKEGNFKRWQKDFFANVRRKLGTGSLRDYERLMGNRLLDDPAYNDRLKPTEIKPKAPDLTGGEEPAKEEGESDNLEGGETKAEGEGEPFQKEGQGLSKADEQEILDRKAEGLSPSEGPGVTRAWMGPGGRLFKTDNHYGAARNILGDDNVGVNDAYKGMFKKQYLRYAENKDTIYYETGGEPLTSSQRSELKNLSIEKSKAVISDDTGRILYSPDNMFQGTTQGLKVNQGQTPSEVKANLSEQHAPPEDSFVARASMLIKEGHVPGLASDVSLLETHNKVTGKYAAPKIREWLDETRANEGKYLNASAKVIDKLNKNEKVTLYATLLSEDHSGVSHRETLPQSLKASYDELRRIYKQGREDQIKAGQPVFDPETGKYREAKINPHGWFNVVGTKQVDTLLNHTGSPYFNKLKDDFINLYETKYGKKGKKLEISGENLFNELIASYGGKLRSPDANFNAVRKAEGLGLPDSWIEPDFGIALKRYWKRFAKDRAFHDVIETDHNMLHILGRTKDAMGNPIKPDRKDLNSIPGNESLSNILDAIYGRNIKTNPRLDALSQIASNLTLGPATAIYDFVTAVPLLMKFTPGWGHIGALAKGLAKIPEGIKHAKSTGFIKENLNEMRDLMLPDDDMSSRLKGIANMIAKVTGREALEKVNRGLSQATGEVLTGIHKGLALSGNKSSLKLMEGLAPEGKWKDLSKEELGTRLAQLAQGTYDVRGLPSWALDSQVAPFFRLAKWSIEQTNNFTKHVAKPAMEGNLNPLLFSIFGATTGGALVKMIKDQLGNNQIPTLGEIDQSKDEATRLKAFGYYGAALVSYSGYMGILGDLMKSVGDAAFKNRVHGFNYPLASLVQDTSEKTMHMASAIAGGEDPGKVLPAYLQDVFKNNTQVGRMAFNFFETEDEKIDKATKRSKRVFEQLSGYDVPNQTLTTGENPYLNLEDKEFKKSGDIKEAVELGKERMKDIIEENRGEPEKLKSKLRSLKANSLQTFPAPERQPLKYSQFVKFQDRTVGKEETDRRKQRFFKQRAINQAKSGLVPSL